VHLEVEGTGQDPDHVRMFESHQGHPVLSSNKSSNFTRLRRERGRRPQILINKDCDQHKEIQKYRFFNVQASIIFRLFYLRFKESS
jgi:hypothetical protein